MALLALIGCAAIAVLGRIPGARPDDLATAQARVEALYAAGSLPEALRAAKEGLREHPEDPILLRRASQLALTLRAPGLARDPVRRLEALSREGSRLPAGSLEAWRLEAADFVRQLELLVARERAVDQATVRARAVSLSFIALLGAGLVLLAKRSRPPPESGSGR